MSDLKLDSRAKSLLLLFSILTLLAITLLLTSYQSRTCSSICITAVSKTPDYWVYITLWQGGRQLPTNPVVVTVNGKYRSQLTTNSKSILAFQAPLGVGLDSIEVQYGGSASYASFFYLGNLLYMLLIPASILVLLLLRELSLDSPFGKKVSFYSDDKIGVSAYSIKEALEPATKKPKRILDLLPDTTDLSKQPGLLGKDPTYISQKLALEGLGSAIISSKEASTAKAFYESSLLSGSDADFSEAALSRFLSSNRIISKEDLTLERLHKIGSKRNAAKLFLTIEEACELSRTAKSYTKAGSTLLLLLSEGLIETNLIDGSYVH